MASVTTLLKIMPVDDEVELEAIEEQIEEIADVEDTETEPVAFGLKSLKILVSVPEDEGTEDTVDSIKEIDGVKTVEVESVNRE